MMAYHFLSPALSVEENGLMAYLQTPPDAGPSVTQVTTGLQNWKCAGRRLVEIGGRLPTATQLHQAFIKILSKHLAGNKKVNFVFQQQSSTIPMMNPSPTEIVELFSFVEATLIQYATVAGHFPSATAASVKARPKKVNKIEVPAEEIKIEAQAQCIYFFRGTCQRGDQCKYEHQVSDDGQPIPVAQRSFRDLRMLLRDTARLVLRQNRNQLPVGGSLRP